MILETHPDYTAIRALPFYHGAVKDIGQAKKILGGAPDNSYIVAYHHVKKAVNRAFVVYVKGHSKLYKTTNSDPAQILPLIRASAGYNAEFTPFNNPKQVAEQKQAPAPAPRARTVGASVVGYPELSEAAKHEYWGEVRELPFFFDITLEEAQRKLKDAARNAYIVIPFPKEEKSEATYGEYRIVVRGSPKKDKAADTARVKEFKISDKEKIIKIEGGVAIENHVVMEAQRQINNPRFKQALDEMRPYPNDGGIPCEYTDKKKREKKIDDALEATYLGDPIRKGFMRRLMMAQTEKEKQEVNEDMQRAFPGPVAAPLEESRSLPPISFRIGVRARATGSPIHSSTCSPSVVAATAAAVAVTAVVGAVYNAASTRCSIS